MKLEVLLAFIGGVAVGAVGMNLYLKDKLAQELAEEQEAAEDYVNQAIDKFKKDAQVLEDTIVVGEKKEEDLPVVEATKEDIKEYKELSGEYRGQEEEDGMSDHSDEIYVITEADYFQDDNYSKTALDYYPETGELLDDEGDPIEYVNSTVGIENLEKFGKTGDLGVLYVRNEVYEADYEITKMISK